MDTLSFMVLTLSGIACLVGAYFGWKSIKMKNDHLKVCTFNDWCRMVGIGYFHFKSDEHYNQCKETFYKEREAHNAKN